MSEKQPPTVKEGATSGDIEEDQARVPASAEDRKAASALANLDAADDSSTSTSAANVDADAISKATKGAAAANAPVKKNVKVDAADVTLLVNELDLSKVKATELLKSHDGDAVKALRAYVQPV